MKIRENNYYIYIILFLFIASAFSVQCARPTSPMGGPKDTIPPIIKDISPNIYATNSRPKKIVFLFNEFMKVDNPYTKVIVSPPMDVKPTVEVNGKKIITTIPDEALLDSNTTYVIDYSTSLQDNNEGNPARQIKYVFSTGDSIDQLTMSGLVVDAKTEDSIVNAIVMLFAPIHDTVTIDSTLFKGKVLGYFSTDSAGVYIASHLKDREYRVYAFEDKDKNMVYTPGKDRVGFLDTHVNPAQLEDFKMWYDPISREVYGSPQVKIRLFEEKAFTPQRVESTTLAQESKVVVKFASSDAIYSDLKIDSIDNKNLIVVESTNKDSLTIWIRSNGVEIPDSLRISLKYLGYDTTGNQSMVDYKTIIESKSFKILTREEKRELKKGDKPTLWERILLWFRFKYRADQRKLKIEFEEEKARQYAEYLVRMDSLRNDTVALEAFRLDSLRLDSIRLDSLRLDSIKLHSVDSLATLQLTINPASEFNPKNIMSITTPYPIDTLKVDSIWLYKYAGAEVDEDTFDEEQASKGLAKIDTTEVAVKFVKDTTNILKYNIVADWQSDAEYEFVIRPKTFIDITGFYNDSIQHKFSTVAARKTSQFNIDVKGVDSTKYLLEIVSSGGAVEFFSIVDKDSLFSAPLIPKGDYKIKVTLDANGNGKFDDGNLVKRMMPEEIDFYRNDKNEILITTAVENFEYDIVLDLNSMFGRKPKESEVVDDNQEPKAEPTEDIVQ